MKSLRILAGIALFSSITLPLAQVAHAQSKEQSDAGTSPVIATVKSVRALSARDGSEVEIISDHPLQPSLSKLENPPRVVIDLPNAHVSEGRKRIPVRGNYVAGIRVSQFQGAVARIVVDLAEPVSYSWDVAGNHLLVYLHALPEDTANASLVPTLVPTAPAAVVSTSASPGAAVLADNRLAAGSSVTAGSDTALISLARGGEVRICPGTTVSVTPSQNGQSLMLGMSTGALEAHYALGASSDTVLTPDFRILMAGPGEFHFGISADTHGNTCVQALPGNTASVIVSELLGDGTYQVKPTQQVVFRSGQLKTADSVVLSGCGCPAPTAPVMRTANLPAVPEHSGIELARNVDRARPARVSESGLGGQPVHSLETAALPPSKPDDIHVQVDVPFVFRAEEHPIQLPAQVRPAPTQEAELLPLGDLQFPEWFQLAALPPRPVKVHHHGFFGRLKGFFSAVFG